MAAEGDVRSAFTLGKLYLQGSLNTDQDVVKAAAYFQIGTQNGHIPSIAQLGQVIMV
jgi:TPR repeat protein